MQRCTEGKFASKFFAKSLNLNKAEIVLIFFF